MTDEDKPVGKMIGMPLPDEAPGSFRATIELLIEAGAIMFVSGTRGLNVPDIEGEPSFEVCVAGDMFPGSPPLKSYGFVDNVFKYGALWRDRDGNSIYFLNDSDLFNNLRKAFEFLRNHPRRTDVKFRKDVINEFSRPEPKKLTPPEIDDFVAMTLKAHARRPIMTLDAPERYSVK